MRFAAVKGLLRHVHLLLISTLCLHAASTKSIQPIPVTFAPDFIGYDGQWSPAQIRVGNPEQYLSLLPSTTESETRVVGPAGCDGTSTCSSLRGGLFSSSQSTTWQELGLYELGYSTLTQNTDNGDYGVDTISISDTISSPDQIIAIVNDTRHWIGKLGLGVKDTRFQNETNYLPFISTLMQNESLIPSHSYGYTAGAYYKGQSVLGSLTLGGVDTTRYVPNNFSFSLAPGYIPSVTVDSLQVFAADTPLSWTANPLTLMPAEQAAVFTIESSTPFLWFPRSVCENIAQALNLTWNPRIQLYTFANDSTSQTLLDQNLQFTFNLANSVGATQTLALNISYNAFNLQLSYPFPGLFTSYTDQKVNYFPMRPANSSNQYIIGRSFLQEAYLTVDYERNLFTLSQALFPDSSQQPVLAAIERPKDSTWPGPNNQGKGSKLSKGAIVGIAVGATIVLAVVVALSCLLCTRRRRHLERLDDGDCEPRTGFFSIFFRRHARKRPSAKSAYELHADKRQPSEMVSDFSNSRYELSGGAPAEMPAGDVAPTFFQERLNAHIKQRNDPRSPTELPQKRPESSIEKGSTKDSVELLDSPAPAYSSTESTQGSNSISPYTPIGTNPFRRGSDLPISPLNGSSDGHSDLSFSGRLQRSSRPRGAVVEPESWF